MSSTIEKTLTDSTDELSRGQESSNMHVLTISVTLTTALQIALVDLLATWGVRPTAVVGHSNGEAAAAYAAGYLTASETIVNSYYRALAITRNSGPGAMIAVGLGAEHVAPYLDGISGVVIACHNSPESVTLSGDEPAIDEIHTKLREKRIFARKLLTSGKGFHSHLTRRSGEYLLESFKASFAEPDVLSLRPTKAHMYSSVTNRLVCPEDVDISYWRSNMVSPVLFNEAAQTMFKSCPSIDCVVEIGPHSALSGPFKQIRSALGLSAEHIQYLPTLVRGQNGLEDMLRLAGNLFVSGYPVDVCEVNAQEVPGYETASGPRKNYGRHLADLPTYQWNYESMYWAESRISLEQRYRTFGRHDLLGSRDPGCSQVAPSWRNMLSLKDIPWFRDHKIGNDILFPASGYASMAIEAASQAVAFESALPSSFTIQNLSIASPIILVPNEDIETVFNLWTSKGTTSHSSTQDFDFRITSTTRTGKWTKNASGKIIVDMSSESKYMGHLH
jgi:acyl transferase domain-containing protein